MRLSSTSFIEVAFGSILGKIMIELNFRDLYKLKPYFSEKTLRKIVS